MVDPHECFDQLLSQIYMFQNNGQYIICGDFNARCGNEANYIEEVDDVIERSIVDYRKNHYGDILLEFLINSNCVMLNGRCAGDNDFTSISVKGVSVVDYVVVPHDYLHKCSGFCVKRAHDLFVQTDLLGRCDPGHNLSYHSMLVWKYILDDLYSDLTIKRNSQLIKIRIYDVSQVPDDFMCDTAITINVSDIRTDIDQLYLNFCDVVKSEMETSLPSKCITLNTSKQRQVFSRVKPWWTDRLKDLWASCCVAERNMGIVENGRQLFQQCHRDLDREGRAAKGQYWYQQQKSLLDMKQSTDFWKTMDQMGISQSQVHQIPWEVINDGQSISANHNIVLNRWKTAFEQLLNSNQSASEIPPELMCGVYPMICDTTTLNADITVDEVRFALLSAKRGKSLGEDGIPIEVLHNDSSLAYLVNLLNVYFMDGYIPDAWSRGIICPIIKDTKIDHRDPLNYRGITITSATYKPFCSILNNRLTRTLVLNNVIADE